jgi:CRP-like cAMP-binding protein
MCDLLRQLTQFEPEVWALFRGHLTEALYAKKANVLSAGQPCKYVYFVESGLLRSFHVIEGEERNTQFTMEGGFVTDLKALRENGSAQISIQAMEPTRVFRISKSELMALYSESVQIEEFGRRMLEMLLEQQEEYRSWFQLYTAKERYALIERQQPALLQRLSLTHLASFLGMRRETLSRIRRP